QFRIVRHEQIFFVAFFAIVAILALIVLWPFLNYIVLAGILTYALFPIYSFLYGRLGRPSVSSALAVVVILLLILLPTVLLIGELVRQVSGAYSSLKPQNIERITEYLDRITGHRFQQMLDSGLEQLRTSILGIAPNVLGSIGELLVGLFVMFFVMYY